MLPVHIRNEQSEDREGIFIVHEAAFGRRKEAEIVNKLRESQAYVPDLSFVAIINDQIVGHILFTRVNISNELKTFKSLSLSPMAVMPAYQQKGIGHMLVREGLIKAKNLGFRSVIVLGHENFYPRFGFEPASRWNIKAPFEVSDKAFLAIELLPNGLKNVSGIVQYDKEIYA